MNDENLERLQSIATDRIADEDQRVSAMRGLANLPERQAVETLLEIANRQDESEDLLRAAGSALAALDPSRVSNWDLRDMTDAASETFFE